MFANVVCLCGSPALCNFMLLQLSSLFPVSLKRKPWKKNREKEKKEKKGAFIM